MQNGKKLLLTTIALTCSIAFLSSHAETTSTPNTSDATAQIQLPPGAKNEMKQQLEAKFFETNKKMPGIVTTPSGLQYKILVKGPGKKPSQNDTVQVHYEGKLLNGQVFDSSYQRGEPAEFAVSDVIAGWQEALQLMPAGSTWMVYIPSKLAYGEAGAGGIIGPNEPLIFKVNLIKIK